MLGPGALPAQIPRVVDISLRIIPALFKEELEADHSSMESVM
jgi:hypothetical protein